VVFNRRTNRLQAFGNVIVRQPDGTRILANKLDIDRRFRDGFARHVTLLMTNRTTLNADVMERKDGNLTIFTNMRYTACDKCRVKGGPLWEVRSKKAVHDKKKGRIYHYNLHFRLADMPVFWLPWLSHPDADHPRATGFLSPAFSYSSTLGLGVSTPFFVNLAPNYDLTLIPTGYTQQGLLARAIWRHRTAFGTYEIDGGGIYQWNPAALPAPGNRRWRWFIRGKGAFTFANGFKGGFDGALYSDRTMMRAYEIDKRDMIESKVWLERLAGRQYAHAGVSHFRDLLKDATGNEVVPHLALTGRLSHTIKAPVLGGALRFEAAAYSVSRIRSHIPFSDVRQALDQKALAATIEWKRRLTLPGGIVATPFAALFADVHNTTGMPAPLLPGGSINATTTRLMPVAGLDVRWPFINAGNGGGGHIVTPVVQVIAARDEPDTTNFGNENAVSDLFDTTTLFLHDRFSGFDRREGGVRLNAGLVYTWLLANGGFVRASAGRSWHLAGRNSHRSGNGLGTPASDYVASLTAQPVSWGRFSWQGRFDSATLAPRLQQFSGSFMLKKRGGADVSYLYAAPDAQRGFTVPRQQIALGGTLWLNDRWRIYGSWRYDLINSTTVSHSIGLGYECDCTTFSLEYKRDFTSDADATPQHHLLVSVHFRTLGGTSADLGKLLFKEP
ncbi:MAG TPA: LPS-assembly protein LptD, partial [Thermopetrobacter sp.]|nr:LPS-assembly protein LptD [Thermopetrobacter sp.]